MNQLASVQPTWKEKLGLITAEVWDMPQVETPVTESWEGDDYVREMRIPAGTLFVGRRHKLGHLCQLVEGSLILIMPNGNKARVDAPYELVTVPGYHMVFIALTDIVGRTVHDRGLTEDQIFGPKDELRWLGERTRYKLMLAESWINEEALRPLWESEEDLVPFEDCSLARVKVAPSPLHGQGLFATANVPQGCFVASMRMRGKRTPAGRYTNHSFNPNTRVFRTETNDMLLVALRSIEPGDEITVDYRAVIQEQLCQV